MITPFNVVALTVVGLFVAVYVAALVVQVRQRLEIRAEHRATAATARDFAASRRAGHVESPDAWAARTQPERRQP